MNQNNSEQGRYASLASEHLRQAIINILKIHIAYEQERISLGASAYCYVDWAFVLGFMRNKLRSSFFGETDHSHHIKDLKFIILPSTEKDFLNENSK